MKRMICMILSLVMALSLAVPAFADTITNGDSGNTTQVTYDAAADGGSQTQENWTVTVPMTMKPGETKKVAASGNWATNRELLVSVTNEEKKVDMTYAGETIELAITFEDWTVGGNNAAAIAAEKDITVADWTTAPILGTWSGTITYSAALQNVTPQNP